MNSVSKIALLIASVGLVTVSTVADARPTRGKVAGQHGSVSGVKGPNGGAVRGRGAKQNDDGSVTAASGGAVNTPKGKGARGSTTTVNPDGSANRKSGAAATGANGSVATSSDVTRNADGSYSGGRTTTATGQQGTYNGSTQIDPATGKPVRAATCTDANGAQVACPR